ncbi:zinc finger domain-containing protein [Amycolatopsis dendrobii]|uniref:DNA-binding phage zinc finger domain-containing protein n=1 Tax=Amycolatopsis dendrobii TaxID=2760662 RepID=A0A7W3VUM7_9PSEU|nr:hypothetical protein [Amycolatopsis dendrobii]MBB1153470.1 hypothetical protein [Amycolatopsis dendrobii]
MTPHPPTESEIRQLLAIAMAYDHRKPGDAQVMAWHEASRRALWTFDEAREAILNHFATSTAYLMPGHVTSRIREARSQPPPRAALPSPPANPASPERIRVIVRDLAARLGWVARRPSPQEQAALAYACPYCHAAVGRRCTRQLARGHRRGQYVEIRDLHPSRVELARADQEGQQ